MCIIIIITIIIITKQCITLNLSPPYKVFRSNLRKTIYSVLCTYKFIAKWNYFRKL